MKSVEGTLKLRPKLASGLITGPRAGTQATTTSSKRVSAKRLMFFPEKFVSMRLSWCS